MYIHIYICMYVQVPHNYRRHMPDFLKSRSSHDIVLLCVKCHQLASFHADSMRAQLAFEYQVPLHAGPPKVHLTHALVRTHTHTHAHTFTLVHTYTHPHTHTHTHPHTHTHAHARARAHTHTHIHTYIYTPTHTHTHTSLWTQDF